MRHTNSKPAVWIDLENAPQVWVLSPILEHLRHAGYPILLSARDFSCTVGLCRRLGYDVQVLGRPGPARSRWERTTRVAERAWRLYTHFFRERPRLGVALNAGSRSQSLAAHFLGLDVVSLVDYEHSDLSILRFVDHLLFPFPIPKEAAGRYAGRVTSYPGLKEELYLCSFQPRRGSIPELGHEDRLRVLMRPEGRFTHYRSAQSEVLQGAILDYLAGHPDVYLVLLPRDAEQGQALSDYCTRRGIAHWIPQEVLDGPSLIWEMDLVVGGGGTMTREAATLGVPSYSFFAGQWGAVDRYLQAQGRLVRLSEVEDVHKIRLQRRERAEPMASARALDFVTGFLEGVISRSAE